MNHAPHIVIDTNVLISAALLPHSKTAAMLVVALERFEQENPGTKIVQHFDSQEEYKRDFEKRIAQKPIDVALYDNP